MTPKLWGEKHIPMLSACVTHAGMGQRLRPDQVLRLTSSYAHRHAEEATGAGLGVGGILELVNEGLDLVRVAGAEGREETEVVQRGSGRGGGEERGRRRR